MLEVTKDSHLDHGLTPAHIEWLVSRYKDKNEFFIETVDLPDELSTLECGLYGPAMGDVPVPEEQVFYGVRGTRKCASRLVKQRKRATRKLTIVAGPHEDRPCVLYTSYGGPNAPREPGDPDIKNWEQLLEARAFWKEHALAAE